MSNKAIKALARAIREAKREADEMVQEPTIAEQPEIIVRGTTWEIAHAIAETLHELDPKFDRLRFERKCGL